MTRGGKRPNAGRPRQGDGRFSHLHIRIPRAKLEAYQQAAASSGTTLTDWVETAMDLRTAKRKGGA